jgi:hypothetical protein
MGNNFEAGDVLKVLTLNRNLLSQWHHRGQVQATVKADGSGTRNLYSFEAICQIELFRRLNKEKFSRDRAGEFAFSKKTESAFRFMRSYGRPNLLTFYSNAAKFRDEIRGEMEGVNKINPMSGESSGGTKTFTSAHIKMAFLRYPDGRLRADYFDGNNFAEMNPEIMLSESVYIIDLLDIVIYVLKGFEKAGLVV